MGVKWVSRLEIQRTVNRGKNQQLMEEPQVHHLPNLNTSPLSLLPQVQVLSNFSVDLN